MKRMLTFAAVLLIAAWGAGCDGDRGSGPSPDATAHWAVLINTTAPAGPTIHDGDAQRQAFALPGDPDSMTISGGALLIRSLRLLANGSAGLDTNITAEDESRDQNDGNISYQGPYRLAFDDTGTDLGTVVIPAGNYQRLVFVVQPGRAGDDLGGSDDMVGRSIVVTGIVWRKGRGENFVFTTDYASEFAVSGDFTMTAGASVTGRLTFGADRWFRSGSRWLDPSNAANRRTVLDNVRRNISAQVKVPLMGGA